MSRRLHEFAVMIALLMGLFPWAQSTRVSGTLTDTAAGQVYKCGIDSVSFYAGMNAPFVRSDRKLSRSWVSEGSVTSQSLLPVDKSAKLNGSWKKLSGTVTMDCTASTSRYPCTDAGFASALLAAGNNGTVVIPSSESVSLTAAHSVSTSTSIRCEPGGGFRYPPRGDAYIALNSAGGIDGCFFKGQGSSTTQQPLILVGSNEYLRNNTISDFGSSGGSGTVEVTGVRHIRIIGNVITNCTDVGIFVNNLTARQADSDITISDNQVCNGIIIHATGTRTSIRHFTVSGNDIYAGENGNTEFGIEIGQFGGASVSDFNVVSNHIYLTAGGTDGCSSLSTVSNFSEKENTCNAKDHTYLIATFELAIASDGTVESNYASSGSGGDGFTCDRCTNVSFAGNTQNGFGTDSNDYGFHVIASSTIFPTVANDKLEGNTIIFPKSGAGIGIWQQCNASRASCKHITYGLNTIISDGTSGSRCMMFENDMGTSRGIALTLNTCKTAAIPYWFGSGVTFSKITERGSRSLSGGTATVMFSPAFDSTPSICNATDATAANPVKAICTPTQMTLAGKGTDTINWTAASPP